VSLAQAFDACPLGARSRGVVVAELCFECGPGIGQRFKKKTSDDQAFSSSARGLRKALCRIALQNVATDAQLKAIHFRK